MNNITALNFSNGMSNGNGGPMFTPGKSLAKDPIKLR